MGIQQCMRCLGRSVGLGQVQGLHKGASHPGLCFQRSSREVSLAGLVERTQAWSSQCGGRVVVEGRSGGMEGASHSHPSQAEKLNSTSCPKPGRQNKLSSWGRSICYTKDSHSLAETTGGGG